MTAASGPRFDHEPVSAEHAAAAEIPDVPAWRRHLPAQTLYWAVVPAAATGTAPPLPSERYAAERWLPVDADQLHVAAAALGDGRRVVVGIEPERLRRWLADAATTPGEVWELVPDGAPPGVASDAITSRLSLLHGPFEPAGRRRARRRITAAVVGSLAVGVLCALVGTERTVAWAQRESARLRTETTARIAALLPPAAGDPSTAEERLLMATRRLPAAGTVAVKNGVTVPHLLQQLLAALPPGVRVQTEALTVNAERVTCRVRVPDLVAAENLHQAWQSAAGSLRFRAEALQAQAVDGGAVAVISLVAEAP